jgi:hypothetical protein
VTDAATIQGIEMMNMIRKGQVRSLAKSNIAGFRTARTGRCCLTQEEQLTTVLVFARLRHIPYADAMTGQHQQHTWEKDGFHLEKTVR